MFNPPIANEVVPQPLWDLLTLVPESHYDTFIQHLPDRARAELVRAPMQLSAESLEAVANAVWATLEN